ncbi:sulfur carrier protein ThiS [Tepidimonas charontis]|uniref:Sulfur carrier protein ThiS n=1 Tax=Tepidimonas charontis TaxID=2267262 RepID=A0A554XKQ0_9BURK|nr:sulfur carrier protein ThiS [Tepidimonas charontis]TSE36396.1 Sulfur carrier protein ThiS [Tepidimonas charontis]
MQVFINAQPHQLADGATVADAVAALRPDAGANAPFAVALNLQFVPRAQYAQTPLHDGDRLEIITPVVGG